MMNTLHKTLIIATLIISTFISGINADLDDGFFLIDKIRPKACQHFWVIFK